MNGNQIVNVAFAVLLITMFLSGSNEAQARGSNRNAQRAMQQLRQQQAKQMQAMQAAAAKQAAMVAAEQRRKFEMYQKASKARNEKIDADREAARERRLAEQRTKDATPAKDMKPKP